MAVFNLHQAECIKNVNPEAVEYHESDDKGRLFESEGWEGGADVSDWEPFRLLGRSMVDYIADYYRDVESRPVRAQVEPEYLQVKI